MKIYIYLTIFWISLLSKVSGQLPDSLSGIFHYQKYDIPDFTVDSTYIIKNVKVEKITYLSTDSFLVSAFLTQPVKKQSMSSLIVYSHWAEGDKSEFLNEAVNMSVNGFICILPDGPWLCPGSKLKSFKQQAFLMYRQNVLNMITAIDLMEQSLKFDQNKIFFAGHSLGCNTAVILAAIEPRIDYFVFMTGVYSSTENILNSTFSDFVEWRTKDPDQFADWIKTMKSLDTYLYMPYKRSPCLIQTANQDEYITNKENDLFIENTKLPKEVIKYDSNHKLNIFAQKKREEWILKNSMR